MCQALAILIAHAFLFTFGSQADGPDRHHIDSVYFNGSDGLGLCDDEHHPVTVTIEDRSLMRYLTEQSEKLLESGQTVDTQTLIKQLDLHECELELPEPKPELEDRVTLFERARNSVVVVGGLFKCKKCARRHVSTASGFVITSSGAVVTNYHVVDADTKKALVVMTSDRHVYPVERVLAASRDNDLAILQIAGDDLQPLPIATSPEAARIGSAVNVISHPAAKFYTCTAGMVSRHMTVRSANRTMDALSITADFGRGSSGAPVFNAAGQVIAIVKSTQSVYHTQTAEERKNLQMVVKTCIPAKSLLNLIN